MDGIKREIMFEKDWNQYPASEERMRAAILIRQGEESRLRKSMRIKI